MVLTQTIALFLDAYRDLNSKKLFWLTLAISGVVVAAFAALGINEKGITLLWWNLGDFGGMVNSSAITPEQFYKGAFVNFGIAFWLSWLATILALISTAGLIPSFVQGGAVELVLSKPIARVRLFLTKFVCGLLFVALQVAVFSIACFLMIGLRGKSWEPGVFLAIPLVVIFFSYLYSICALVGLLTRSTIAALLITLLAWLGLFSLNAADGVLVQVREVSAMNAERAERRLERNERLTTGQWQQLWVLQNSRDLPDGAPRPTPPQPTREQLDEGNPDLAQDRRALEDARQSFQRWQRWTGLVVTVKTIVPKTGETIELLSRTLKERMAITPPPDPDASPQGPIRFGDELSREDQRELVQRVEKEIHGRSVWWVLGTSLLFEGVVLTIACIVFARRDF